MVFPVEDLDSCISVVRIAQQLDTASSSPAPSPVATTAAAFRECVLVRPGSTLTDVYQVLQHCGFVGQDRDLVRTERLLFSESSVCQSAGDSDAVTVSTSKERISLKKGDLLLGRFVVLKVFTNVRKEWQRNSHAR